jgi:predicted dehydrogenase
MVPGIRLSRNGTALAVASRRLETAQDFARSLGVDRAYGSYAELLEDADVEAIYIPLPNSQHREWTVRAAEKGKHVLCEKPLACSTREALEMAQACMSNGVNLMEAFAQRFRPQNIQVKELVEQGRIGKVLWMTVVHSSARPRAGDIRLSRELCGGVLMDKGCYCVDTARFIFGSEPVSVFATAEFGESGVDERVTARLEFPDGGVAHFDSGFGLTGNTYQQSYTVLGEKGHIYVPNGHAQVETYRTGAIVDTVIYVGDDAVLDPATERVQCKEVHQWQLEAEYFADRVLGGEDIQYPAGNGVDNMRVIDAIYRSAREGRTVDVEV